MRATDSPLLHLVEAPPSVGAATHPAATLRSLRHQAAVVRALLDELELRTAPSEGEVADQLADEVGRLGGELLRASVVLRRSALSLQA